MTTKNQGPRHSLPPKPMVAPPSTTDDPTRNQVSLTERCVFAARERQMDWTPMQWTTPTWTGQGWSTTPPFPTPALTASSLSSSSFYGERSPILAPAGAGQYSRRNFDVPSMTSLPPAKSFDDASSRVYAVKNSTIGNGEQAYTAEPLSYQQYDGDMAALSSSMNGLNMSEQHGQVSARSLDSASHRIASALTEPRPPAPLLIPMQPTGAGVPLTSVVETLSSKGSKAASEDPETVAAAYKLSQWGIGIGPGINPKVASSRNGTHGRGRSTASEPPIVNTGNSGPMCVQPGDWICTSCGFVNWRRRDVCMRCYPHADGNEMGRGIQCGEMLAKRLAAGLDTDTEEYRRSVQALCPDKVKRGLDTYPQRAPVHQLPRNPLQAYSSGSPSIYNPGSFLPLHNANVGSNQASGSQTPNVSPSNLLGIHMNATVMQQWEQQTERSGAMSSQYLNHGHDQQQTAQAQSYSHISPSQQQLYLNGDHRSVSSPCKMYCPQMNMATNASTALGPVDYERPGLHQRTSDYAAQPGTDTAGARMSLQRSATHTGADEPRRQTGYQAQPQPLRGGGSGAPNNSPVTGWARSSQEPASLLPKDIWAPAPKRPALIPVDPEDVSRERRAKPQPIGTRSAATTTTATTATATSNGPATPLAAPGNNNTTEPAGRKDIDWISDSLTSN
ncbi:uncharacterized protein UTRI_02939 [Ustilago trichophora]|uniref:RanBP2-type domain-containing protein n=1 Tax=Ustilago trichophora TaxID=86804 RepID=A0A5C3EPK8_9BASI|nr:uncharacterized protein UTRI_02939 [Ustilago trichophora]